MIKNNNRKNFSFWHPHIFEYIIKVYQSFKKIYNGDDGNYNFSKILIFSQNYLLDFIHFLENYKKIIVSVIPIIEEIYKNLLEVGYSIDNSKNSEKCEKNLKKYDKI